MYIQSNFNGSSIFWTMGICSRFGLLEPLRVDHSTSSGGKWRYFRDIFSSFNEILVCWVYFIFWCRIPCEPENSIFCNITCLTSNKSVQPAHVVQAEQSHCFALYGKPNIQTVCSRTTEIWLKTGGCEDWAGSSLGVQVIWSEMLCPGSILIYMQHC